MLECILHWVPWDRVVFNFNVMSHSRERERDFVLYNVDVWKGVRSVLYIASVRS